MPDDSRIEELRRRLRKDSASIAFAQLGEELRRAGRYQEAVDACGAGLAKYPAYLSARVTLGRALIALNRLDEARREVEEVLKSAPDNLAAMRALAEIRSRQVPQGPQGPRAEAESVAVPRSWPGGEAEYGRVVRTMAALESWLSAIHVARAGRSA